MKKSLIAAAVAGLFAAPAAMAEVTISGAINLGIEAVSSNDAPAIPVTDTGPYAGLPAIPGLSKTFLNANYSNINISSSDDIGNGNKIIFNYQLVVDPATFGNPVNRNSYLGVAGTWGAFKMGANENVYERHMYQADPLDGAVGPGGNLMILGTAGGGVAFEVGQAGCDVTTGGAGCSGFYRRSDNTIWYESPNWSGFTFEVDYTLSASKTATTDPQILSVGAKWQPQGMPFYLDIAFEQHDDMFGVAKLVGHPGTSSSDDAAQIGGGFSIAGFDMHLRYEELKYENTSAIVGDINTIERNAMWFGVKYNLPSGYIGGEVGQAGDWDVTCVGATAATCTSNDTGALMYGIGYFHNLSKQSQLQFIYATTDNDSQGTYTQAGAPSGGVPGSDHDVLHVGIKHTF